MPALTINRIVINLCKMSARMHFSYGSASTIEYSVIRLYAGDLVGYGESNGTTDRVFPRYAQPLIGKDARALDALLPDEERSWDFGRCFVRESLSMALHDLVAKAHGMPLHTLLGGLRRRRVPLMPCVFPEDPDDAARITESFLKQGFKSIKVKLFGKLEGDVAIIRAVRRVFPEGYLQADANLGYKGVEAGREAMARLGEAGLTVAEDPFEGTWDDYAAITREFEKPLHMLDAPSRGWEGIHQACAHHAAHIINLHPNCQGPFSEILGRAAVARAAGIQVMVGGTGYAGVGTWPHAHLASVVGVDLPYGDICGARDHGFPESSAVHMLPADHGDFIVPDTPGHGGVPNLEHVKKYCFKELDLA